MVCRAITDTAFSTTWLIRNRLLHVNDDFDVLFAFFKEHEAEVVGRAAPTVTPELREKISRFAAGKSSEDERAEMKKALQEDPALIPVLISEVEAIRKAAE